MLPTILAVASSIIYNQSNYTAPVVTAAGADLFVDGLGLIIGIWKLVFNPQAATRLGPVTPNIALPKPANLAVPKSS